MNLARGAGASGSPAARSDVAGLQRTFGCHDSRWVHERRVRCCAHFGGIAACRLPEQCFHRRLRVRRAKGLAGSTGLFRMRNGWIVGAAIAVHFACPAWAGDKVLTGPVPSWVAPAPALNLDPSARSGTALPLFDEQVLVDGDTVTAFFDTATVISTPEVLAQRGNLKMSWQPDHGDLTFHRLEIVREGQVIDALAGGAGITVLRREAGLERMIVDGQLTAVKHFEGLRVGDTLRAAFSVTTRDATLEGNVQDGLLLIPAPAKIGFGRARLLWLSNRDIAWKVGLPNVTAVPRKIDARWNEIVIPLPIAKLPEMPKNMPSRFTPVPVVQFSSFKDWQAVARAMAPLYRTEATIAPGSDLAARVATIAARSQDPIERLADALQMVQDEVRYQLIALGTGNYVPQSPAETWSKRYGDCKAKTLLLLAVLDRLGVEAEPVLANTGRGDAVGQMLPAAGAFDHVFVRAKIAGEDFWVDGTMLGSRLADIRDVPRFGTVLPLAGAAPTLVELPKRAHARSDLDVDIAYDMTAGPYLPAPFRLTLRHTGAYAATNRVDRNADYDEKLFAFAEKAANDWIGTSSIGKPRAEFDTANATWTLVVDGVGYPKWQYRDRRQALSLGPTLIVAYDAPRDRAAWRAIPALIDQPWTARSHVSIRLPDDGKGATLIGGDMGDLDLPAVKWQRSAKLTEGTVSEEISSFETGAEIPADRTSGAGRAIADAMAKKARIELPESYARRWDDVARRKASPAVAKVRAIFDERIAAKPDDAGRLVDRGWLQERLLDWSGAEADYAKAIALDPTAARYLNRAQVRSQRGDKAGSLKDAQAAYDLEQGDKEARDYLAVELAEAGRVDEGLDLLPSEPDINTDDGLSDFLHRVDVLESGERHEEALELLDAALEKRGTSAELRNARCWYLALRSSSLDMALADCNRAIELSSDPATYLDSRAMVRFREGKLAEARADYDAALAQEPELASSLYMSAVVSRRLGDKGRADLERRAALTLNPSVERFYRRYGITP
ncbi:DUF3857 domain-containing protein [Novosphingobium sp. JCM 18896]|uniref:DUF3857 domain-containing protein n=1 Tax=Novosphingobium sp. JCM 18896 TaxID=2989731 RepID=UPI00222252C4|nr:DUF3857 domain-containing protein [Novosphingobium sp. JCM 18896]MCW1429515.1 DUF3857 domain-containing protein [Novosphingobium sp. JCM 18896]